MNSFSRFLRCATFLGLLLAVGCGGINASKSVSPLDFLLPGFGSFLKADPAPPAPDQPVPPAKPADKLA